MGTDCTGDFSWEKAIEKTILGVPGSSEFSHSLGQMRKSSERANVFRFAPESGHYATQSACLFRAKCGQSAAQENTSLFDQLVRDAEQTRGDGQPERLGSLHVNGQLEFGRLQNRQIGRFSAH